MQQPGESDLLRRGSDPARDRVQDIGLQLAIVTPVDDDGAHSLVRALAFGPEKDFAHHLGCYYGYYEIDNYLNLDHAGMATGDGQTAALSLFSVKHNAQARVGLLFKTDQPLTYDRHNLQEHKQILTEHAAHLGWETPTLLDKLESVDDLYFDAMTQIRMDTWSRGRIVLVGEPPPHTATTTRPSPPTNRRCASM